MSLNANLEQRIADAYAEGRARFGDLGLERESYSNRVHAIVEKYLGTDPPDNAAADFVKALHGRDLYLATACAQESLGMTGAARSSGLQYRGIAWKTLELNYRGFISDLTRFFFRKSFVAQDIADNILADLFFPDRTGTSRIVSYDGRSSLNTWLRVVVCNQAINVKRRNSYSQTIETIPEIPDFPAWKKVDQIVRLRRYETPFRKALAAACIHLPPRDRLLLLWRYQEGLRLGQIAQILGIHQSNVTRQLDRVTSRFRNHVISLLRKEHGLSRRAIQECLSDIVDNPIHTAGILEFLSTADKEERRAAPGASANPKTELGVMSPRSVRPTSVLHDELRRAR